MDIFQATQKKKLNFDLEEGQKKSLNPTKPENLVFIDAVEVKLFGVLSTVPLAVQVSYGTF